MVLTTLYIMVKYVCGGGRASEVDVSLLGRMLIKADANVDPYQPQFHFSVRSFSSRQQVSPVLYNTFL